LAVNNPNWYAPPAAATAPLAFPAATDDPLDRAEYGGFWIRAGAQLLDTVAAWIFAFVAATAASAVLAVLQAAEVIDDRWAHRIGQAGAGAFVMSALAALAYQSFSEWIGGATLGKLALGLRVRSVDLTPCTLGGAVLRNLAFYIDALFFGMVAYGSMSRSPRKQRLGDKMGRTVVVKVASLGELRPSAKKLTLGIVGGAVLAVAIEFAQTLVAAL
jgi:uncharacterized RDD family membrane protein YckC